MPNGHNPPPVPVSHTPQRPTPSPGPTLLSPRLLGTQTVRCSVCCVAPLHQRREYAAGFLPMETSAGRWGGRDSHEACRKGEGGLGLGRRTFVLSHRPPGVSPMFPRSVGPPTLVSPLRRPLPAVGLGTVLVGPLPIFNRSSWPVLRVHGGGEQRRIPCSKRPQRRRVHPAAEMRRFPLPLFCDVLSVPL